MTEKVFLVETRVEIPGEIFSAFTLQFLLSFEGTSRPDQASVQGREQMAAAIRAHWAESIQEFTILDRADFPREEEEDDTYYFGERRGEYILHFFARSTSSGYELRPLKRSEMPDRRKSLGVGYMTLVFKVERQLPLYRV